MGELRDDIRDVISELESRYNAVVDKDSYNEGYCDALNEAIGLLETLLNLD